MPSAFDRRFWLEDIFNCSTSHMIGWIKYLWECDWSKENDIFDSCQVLSQHESEILNDLEQRLSFLSAWGFDQRFASQIFKWKKIKLKGSLWDQGILGDMLLIVYSCFEKGCLTSGEKFTRQCRNLLWVMVVFTLPWEPQGASAWWKETAQTRIRSFSFLVAESLNWIALNLNQAKPNYHFQ